jgi:hypothetical protein
MARQLEAPFAIRARPPTALFFAAKHLCADSSKFFRRRRNGRAGSLNNKKCRGCLEQRLNGHSAITALH